VSSSNTEEGVLLACKNRDTMTWTNFLSQNVVSHSQKEDLRALQFSIFDLTKRFKTCGEKNWDFYKYLRLLVLPTALCGGFSVSNILVVEGSKLRVQWNISLIFVYSVLFQILSMCLAVDYLLAYGDPNVLFMDKLANLGILSAVTILGLTIRLICFLQSRKMVSFITTISEFQRDIQTILSIVPFIPQLTTSGAQPVTPKVLSFLSSAPRGGKKRERKTSILCKLYLLTVCASFVVENGISFTELLDRSQTGRMAKLQLQTIPSSWCTVRLVALCVNSMSLFIPSFFAYTIIIYFAHLLTSNYYRLYYKIQMMVLQSESAGKDEIQLSNSPMQSNHSHVQANPNLSCSDFGTKAIPIAKTVQLALHENEDAANVGNKFEGNGWMTEEMKKLKLEEVWKNLQTLFVFYGEVVGPLIVTFVVFYTFMITVHLYDLVSTTSHGYFQTYGTIVYLVVCVVRIVVLADVGYLLNSKVSFYLNYENF